MRVLVPTQITDDLLTSSTIDEPDTGETVWTPSTAYALGDRRYRAETHRIYECVQAHTSRTQLPEEDTMYWLEYKPTNRWAMFDGMVSTASKATEEITVVLEPGWFNALALFGLDGESIDITVKDAPGGDVIYSYTGELIEDVGDWYEFFFSPIKPRSKLILSGIEPYAAAELTVTLTGADGTQVALGLLAVGDLRTISERHGVLAGATAEPVDYSYVKTFDDGTKRIVKRNAATDMRASVVLARSEIPYALATVQELLSVPAVWIGNKTAAFDGLSVFGLGSASFQYESTRATMNLTVKGLI